MHTLVKMASSKLVIKKVDRTNLYYNKFCYRVVISAPGLHWVQNTKTMQDFVDSVTARYDDWEANMNRYPNGWYRKPPSIAELDLDLIDKIITLIQKNKDKSKATYRYEGDNMSVFTSDIKLAKTFAKLSNNVITEVNLMPNGIKYFKKDPPAKFRAYMTNNKVSSQLPDDMVEYFNRTPDIQPSGAFYQWLHRRNRYHSHAWLWHNYFIDYNDERNLMMLRLLFPEAIGKTYKLEKKP